MITIKKATKFKFHNISKTFKSHKNIFSLQPMIIHQAQLHSPVSVQQQIILPQRTPIMSYPVLNPTNQIIIQPQYKNNRVIQTIYPEKVVREILPQTSPTALTVQTIQRNDSPTINVISTTHSEPVNIRLSMNSAPTMMNVQSITQE